MIGFKQPIRDGISRTRRILFPIAFRKWLPLTFCSWLASSCPGKIHFLRDFSIVHWAALNSRMLVKYPDMKTPREIAMALGAFAGSLALSVLLSWLAARGSFLFLDNIVHERTLIRKPWKQFEALANDLFLFVVVVLAAGTGLIFLLSLFHLPDHTASSMPGALEYLGFFVLLGGIAIIPFLVFLLYFSDFAIPVMYKTRCNPIVAIVRVWQIISRQPRAAFLYLLLRLVLAAAYGLVTFIIGRLTFSLALLPFVVSFLMLPLAVFRQSFILDCLRQFDPELDLWPEATPPLLP